jgi:hypothetical protein
VIARGTHVPNRPLESSARAAGSHRATVRALWPLLLPVPTVLLASWVILAWHFNGLYGQDPFAYYDFGVGPLRHALLDGAPLTPLFWPLGYPILITVSSVILGQDTTAGQVVNVAAGGASVLLIYLLGRDLLLQSGATPAVARRAGALGALLLGMTGRMLESSVLIMADSVALATSLLSAWALLRWLGGSGESRSGESRTRAGWLAVSATALAWSIVTRWGQALLAFAWLIAAVPALRARWPRQYPWLTAACALIPAAVVLGLQIWLIFAVRPEADLGPLPFAGDLTHLNGADSTWSWLHLFQHRFITADGVRQVQVSNAVFYSTGAFLPEYLTPLFLPVVAIGMIAAVKRYPRSLFLLLSWPAILLFFDAGLAQQNPRYILAALPPIAILAGVGMAVVWEWLGSRVRPPAAVLACAGLLAVAASGLAGVATLNRERNADLQVATWTTARVPAGATTLSFGITLTLQHATALHVMDLSVLSEHDLQRLMSKRKAVYVLAQVPVMTGQFAALPTGLNYRFLQTEPGLTPIGVFHGYTLARVRTT